MQSAEVAYVNNHTLNNKEEYLRNISKTSDFKLLYAVCRFR